MKTFAVAMLFTFPVVAFAATYAVTESGVTTGARLETLGQTGCLYANVPIALGDVLNYPDGKRQVCASGPNGPLMIDVIPAKKTKN